MKYLLIITLIGICSFTTWAQENSRGETFKNDLTPFKEVEVSKKANKKLSRRQYKKSFRYQFNKKNDELVEEFYERIEANKKKYKKMQRIMKRPQYSDPSYFGHKRKPKIRPVGKKKFCTECGIVH